MNNRTINIVGFSLAGVGILLIAYGYYRMITPVLFVGVILVVISVFLIIILQSVNLFVQDKKLDIESLRKQGLTIVECPHCQKENVLEDKYCIYCGEPLGEEHDKT